MRIFLLPISTRRTLLYCHKLDITTAGAKAKEGLAERIQTKAAQTWANWEKKDKGWQKTVVNYGNYALRRIPYEEWGLKSVPPLSERRKLDEADTSGPGKVEVIYPQSLIPADKVDSVLKTLATEREALHKKRFIWCLVGMPISAPVALIPVVPNIPFFYLVYRAWSHWRAVSGGRHLQHLLANRLLEHRPSPIVDEVYAGQEPPLPSTPEPTTGPDADLADDFTSFPSPAVEPTFPDGETMLLSQKNGKRMAQALELPQLEVELERAIWQVETAIKKANEEAGAKVDKAKKEESEAVVTAVSEADERSDDDDKKTR